MKNSPKKTLVLLDGNAIVHRSFHALPPLTTKNGELVNAVYGFALTLLNVIEKFHPDYIAATFDLPKPTFRHEEYADYKATRAKAPDELYAQFARVRELVEVFNIPIYEKEGFEADDVIGTISHEVSHSGDVDVIIATGDNDALQLVDENIQVFTLRKGVSDTVLYDREAVIAKMQLTPEQLPDYKGLRGDTSDNIPGVKGVGEKTAVDLLTRFQTLEGVYEHIDEIKGAIKTKLERDKAQAFLSKRLGTIRLDVPIVFALEKCQTHDFDIPSVEAFLREMNFWSLLKRIPSSKNEISFSNRSDVVQDRKYEQLQEEHIDRFMREIEEVGACALSIDTDITSLKELFGNTSQQEGLFEASNELSGEKTLVKGVVISYKHGRSWYIPYSGVFITLLHKLFTNPDMLVVSFDTKQLYHLLGEDTFQCKLQDLLMEIYVVNPGERIELEKLTLEKLGEEMGDFGEVSGEKGLSQNEMQLCQRADTIFKLHEIYIQEREEITKTQDKKHNITTILQNIELPLVPILAKMEQNGIFVDRSILTKIATLINKKLEELEKKIYTFSKKEFNINSPQQLAKILFETLQLPTQGIKKNKTGYSTAASELEKLYHEHKIIRHIEQYRELFKLKTTYIDALPRFIANDDRIHTSFQQAVTATGRLSSINPNLQNIPTRTDVGKTLREAFVADQGKLLISADYSQIDLRCAAHVTRDKKLIEAFLDGQDIHALTASEVFGTTLSKVTKTMRRQAKVLNFGVLYGMGTFGFARAADVSVEEARVFIADYMQKFTGIAEYMREIKKFARENGYVETIFGRRRYVQEIRSANFQVAASAERMAINMPIQGLTADIMKLAMLETNKIVYQYGTKAKTLLQIHDELIFEVDETIAKKFAQEIKNSMENIYPLTVPLVVHIRQGGTWGQL